MLEPFFGLKTVSVIDVWTLEHIFMGLSIGSAVTHRHWKIVSKIAGVIDETARKAHHYRLDILAVLMVAYIWETIEHYLEMGLGGDWLEFWLQGVEFWPNRILADPIMMVLGYLLARKYAVLVWPARVLSALWLFIHLFIFPHSMYLHELMGF